jgi:CRP/FNR family transcriptional regulator, cyclic AMP receptor protein
MLKSEIATDTAFLLNNGWLRHVPPEFGAAFMAHCHWRNVDAGVSISHAGDHGQSIIGLSRGVVSVFTALSAPDTPIVTVSHPGTWFGFIPMFSDLPRAVSMVARSDVRLAYIAQSEVETLLASRPEWWRHFAALGILYGNSAINVAADLMIRDSKRRCVASILRLADCRFVDRPGGRPIEAPLSQEDLAAISNLSRTSVSTIVRELENQGLISLGYRTIALLDTDRLRALVDNV